MTLINHKYKGFSLIQLTIGLGIGSALIAGFIGFYANTTQSSNILLKTIRLEHELQTAINFIKQDLRRAGYNAHASALIGTSKPNPFMQSNATDIDSPNSHCILFSYDINQTGLLPPLNSAPSDSRFGFRLLNKTLQSRALYDSQFSCQKGQWLNLTEPNLIEISELNFTLQQKKSNNISRREVLISISGHLTKNKNITRTYTTKVTVRNDKYQ